MFGPREISSDGLATRSLIDAKSILPHGSLPSVEASRLPLYRPCFGYGQRVRVRPGHGLPLLAVPIIVRRLSVLHPLNQRR